MTYQIHSTNQSMCILFFAAIIIIAKYVKFQEVDNQQTKAQYLQHLVYKSIWTLIVFLISPNSSSLILLCFVVIMSFGFHPRKQFNFWF
jgi:uncharacterized membrane protein YidH (DUF202 family)